MTRAIVSLSTAMALVVAGLVLTPGQVAASPVDDEQLFVQMVNLLRADLGLPLLAVDPELTSEARAWTSTMASTDQLAHTADMASGISSPWTVLGENVGLHGIHDVQQLFDAFINSPSHYDNLVDPRYRFVGVGVVHSPNGKLWTTHRFMATADQTGTAILDPVTGPSTSISPAPVVSVPDRSSNQEDSDRPEKQLRPQEWATLYNALLDLVRRFF